MKGLVVRYPYCIMNEVEPTITKLQNKIHVDIIDLDNIPVSSHSPDLLLIPGGSCEVAVTNVNLLQLIKKTFDSGGMIAGICNGAVIMASSGILKNRRCTHTAHPKYAPLPEFQELLNYASFVFRDTVYVDEDIVIDDNLITAKPWAANEFANAIVAKISQYKFTL